MFEEFIVSLFIVLSSCCRWWPLVAVLSTRQGLQPLSDLPDGRTDRHGQPSAVKTYTNDVRVFQCRQIACTHLSWISNYCRWFNNYLIIVTMLLLWSAVLFFSLKWTLISCALLCRSRCSAKKYISSIPKLRKAKFTVGAKCRLKFSRNVFWYRWGLWKILT